MILCPSTEVYRSLPLQMTAGCQAPNSAAAQPERSGRRQGQFCDGRGDGGPRHAACKNKNASGSAQSRAWLKHYMALQKVKTWVILTLNQKNSSCCTWSKASTNKQWEKLKVSHTSVLQEYFCQSINSFSQKRRKKVKFNVPTAPTVHSYFHSSSKHKFLSLYFIKQLLSVAGSLSVIKAWSGLGTNYYESQLALKNKKENANIDATTTKGCCSSRICAPPPRGEKAPHRIETGGKKPPGWPHNLVNYCSETKEVWKLSGSLLKTL